MLFVEVQLNLLKLTAVFISKQYKTPISAAIGVMELDAIAKVTGWPSENCGLTKNETDEMIVF